MRKILAEAITRALRDATASGALPAIPEDFSVSIEKPRNPEHGDFATNVAMTLARVARMAPRAIAEALIAHIPFAIRAVRREDMQYMMNRFGVRLREGRFPEPGTSEVILHEDFLKANEWELGSEFGMKVSDDDWMPGRWTV